MIAAGFIYSRDDHRARALLGHYFGEMRTSQPNMIFSVGADIAF